ncbi:hypothetical protein [Acinetobacter sp. WU_MDCI_Abxc222]|uniref:hypothetical protein n=1 Tax=Acinetobacter sp. WU_MDCI_Abxc222 TaxID=2850076 RepID=UPI0021CD672C|nr:hypothetical protein [Acinetobacter sp. WU_MDCI_Abxc222]MCU4564479.1 hypothetical protein [Acinetobacter sp. WU_MDCI_Abxc222]
MPDKVITAIRNDQITEENISFNLVRQIAGNENDSQVWCSLGYGRNILVSCEQLDQYLYSYGPMIQSQWTQICEGLTIDEGNITLLDYGCGQGLASLLLLDCVQEEFRYNVSQLILIEPSDIALTRAEHIVQICYPNARIRRVHCNFDSVTNGDLQTNNDDIKIHLMSNVLDIDGFDHFELVSKLGEAKGVHYFIAVSHDRDFLGGTARLKGLYEAFNEQLADNVLESEIKNFSCSNGQPAISFMVKLEM